VLDSKKRSRLLARAAQLVDGHPDELTPDEVRRTELAPLVRATAASGVSLLVLAALAPRFVDGFAPHVLAGVPGVVHLVLAGLSTPSRRRVTLVLACATSGLLVFATGGAFTQLGRLGAPGQGVVLYPLACFAVAVLHLGFAAPVWRRFNAALARAEAHAAARREL
jgi:hypothetical protein